MLDVRIIVLLETDGRLDGRWSTLGGGAGGSSMMMMVMMMIHMLVVAGQR